MHLAPLIQDLAVILGVAALVTFLFRLIKQPVVLGYIVAGIIVGPYTPNVLSVVDVESVKIWAELGVIFLMFALGLEFSFRRLAKVGVSAGATASVQVVTMIILGYLCGRALGWSGMDSVFLGCMVSISSTTIIIKALEELGLKTRRFAELVFGILIVEDLFAIIMLVALSNIATKAHVSGLDLLGAGGKLALVVGAWLVIGMFAVPRLVRAVGRRGNDEMLIVVSLGLCLALVTLSAYFSYSVALGAFIMGSILAETKEVHKIETLVAPLKDIFGAVFFVSVGMLLDPSIIVHNFGAIAAICLVIIVGMIASVMAGALATGQSLATAVQAGFSMAQIGEFSFIIATLGLSYDAIDAKVYPIIVAASLITTFTTPYFLKAAPRATEALRRALPARATEALEQYSQWFQSSSPDRGVGPHFYRHLVKWAANAIVVVTIFVVFAEKLAPLLAGYIDERTYADIATWAVAFLAAAPFIWAMMTAFPRPSAVGGSSVGFFSRLATVLVVGIVSVEYFAVWVAVIITIAVASVVFVVFRRQLESYYQWFETKFVSGIGAGAADDDPSQAHAHLIPWDARLAEIVVPPEATVVGRTLFELRFRERFGTNVVVINRAGAAIVAPKADERLMPRDSLLCFGTDEELERLQHAVAEARPTPKVTMDPSAYGLSRMTVTAASPMLGRTIRDSGIREEFDCMVVGLERDGERIPSPQSTIELRPGDALSVVGEWARLKQLEDRFRPQPLSSERPPT